MSCTVSTQRIVSDREIGSRFHIRGQESFIRSILFNLFRGSREHLSGRIYYYSVVKNNLFL